MSPVGSPLTTTASPYIIYRSSSERRYIAFPLYWRSPRIDAEIDPEGNLDLVREQGFYYISVSGNKPD